MLSSSSIRVLLVDDSALARGLLRSLLEEAGIEVVGEAVNGRQAVELARKLRPDLITLDLQMPVMGGMETITEIMHEKAIPILVVSSEADAEKACEALEAGALEVIAKPDYTPEQAGEFVRKVRLLAGVSVITRIRRRLPETSPNPDNEWQWQPSHQYLARNYRQAFAIASSTGGPQALTRILPLLDKSFPAPILLAQHMSDGFVEGMVQWLSSLCQLRVKVAEDGELLKPGCVYVSPSESHLTVTANHRVALRPRVEGEIYRPSCDHLLCSLAEVYGRDAVGIILTGMGRDGAVGMQAIRDAGGIGLAQDEATSLIYGMNQEAVKLGGVHREFPVTALGEEMQKILEMTPAGYLQALGRSSA
ncbi:chemotaxis-specific protein-glutamate methyltransferase CheB [Marinospirillum perlucidum]|uniref:chemotaxis-specific protein-glutamate methyltransferase CheB n=1 Tax=Marinospirillum perlucidum TaxID=1982602 RepID=UPI000DF1BFF7|nr:chemotaxis-specific protein-glutamate methyltransferase CheB [Marinospirillum perlucidum]